ncbi:MAG: lactate utilization protein [Caldilineaceae bacterium]
MTARNQILDKLRTTLARPDLHFPPAKTEPLTAETRMTVLPTEGNKLELAKRFGAELEKLHGSFEIVESPAEARLALINRLLVWMAEEKANHKGALLETGQERHILCWNPAALPVSGVDDALQDMEMKVVAPKELRSEGSRAAVRFIRYGITGVDAAFASTGSLLVAADAQTSRSASLLPFRHIALIPFARLYPNVEAWLSEQRQAGALVDYFRSHANVAMISGPSKSADIEMNLTLGVHGPKYVHAILFGKVE